LILPDVVLQPKVDPPNRQQAPADFPAPTVGQLPQSAYHSLLTPYTFFGLGRTNNYIESLFVGSTKHIAEHFINMEGVIPNSKVVIVPPAQEGAWKKELFLRPGEWIPWVTVTAVVATAILAAIVGVLHLSEKVSRVFPFGWGNRLLTVTP
jgi:integrin alpha FG-GAP repeat containing protein 1